MFRIGILIILILLPLQLNAHSPLEFSIPKNGALIDSAPNELVLSFKSPAKLIKVKVAEKQSAEKSSFLKKFLGTKQTNEYILLVRDITELRVNASMRRDFISNLSHELRTPVSVILANAETLLDRTIDNKKTAKTFSKAIMHNAQRISGLVTDLIELSRLDYGELHKDIRPIDIENIINIAKNNTSGLVLKRVDEDEEEALVIQFQYQHQNYVS